MFESHGFSEALDRYRGERVDLPVAGAVSTMSRRNKLLRRLEFSEQSVDWLSLHCFTRVSPGSGCAHVPDRWCAALCSNLPANCSRAFAPSASKPGYSDR